MLLSTGVVIENNEFPKAIQNIKISTKNVQKKSYNVWMSVASVWSSSCNIRQVTSNHRPS